MGIEFDLASLIAFVIDFSQGTTPVADIDSLASGIVGVIAVSKGLESCVRTSIEYPNASILCIGHVQPIGSRHVKDALRLLQAANRLNSFARLNIDNFYCVVTERGNEQSLPLYVNGQVVNSLLHLWQIDGLLQAQRLSCLPPMPPRRTQIES